jgi:phosphatidylserine/phosphatidylglycerophosphate/cardiolipin synthase-like enzyme
VKPVLLGLGPAQLEAIADRLERLQSDDLASPSFGTPHDVALDERFVGELRGHVQMLGNETVAHILRAVATERRSSTHTSDRRLELVWTGPEREGAGTRDTAVVVRELFQQAEHDVLLAGYALYNAHTIFAPLAARMTQCPGLRVRLCLNIPRGDDTGSDDDLVFDFRRRLRVHNWPEGPLPEVYFDPRSLDRRPDRRAVMHAKCVLVDDQRTFLTSANFTEAAQVRNIELGVVVNDASFCRAVRQQFDDLIGNGALRRLELI